MAGKGVEQSRTSPGRALSAPGAMPAPGRMVQPWPPRTSCDVDVRMSLCDGTVDEHAQHDPPVHHLAEQPRLRRTAPPHRRPGKRSLMRLEHFQLVWAVNQPQIPDPVRKMMSSRWASSSRTLAKYGSRCGCPQAEDDGAGRCPPRHTCGACRRRAGRSPRKNGARPRR